MALSDFHLQVSVSESQRQQDKLATPTTAGHAAADLAHWRRVITAGRTWGQKVPGAFQALANVGAPPPPGSPAPGDL
jgi:hypothetical protein